VTSSIPGARLQDFFSADAFALDARTIRGREAPMDFSPGEKAVLGQMRVLYQTAGREQQVKALTSQWPPTHFETYRTAFAGLAAKQLIQDRGAQTFTITDAGLRALGVTPPAPRVETPQPVRRTEAPAPASKPRAGGLRRLVKGLFG
jgi:hypothetical protein